MGNVWKRSLFLQVPHLRGRSTLHFFRISTPFVIVEGELSYEFKTTPPTHPQLTLFFCFPPVYLRVLFRNARRDFQEHRADSSFPQTSASWAGAVGCQALPGAQSCLSLHRPAGACAFTPRQEVGTHIRPETMM